MELTKLPIEELAPLVKRKRVSPVELTRAFLERIERLNPALNAYITVTAERALADARRAEREIGRGKYRGPLHGIPISLKDNIHTKGVRTTAGSKVMASFVPDADAQVAQKLFQAGAVLLGKTNLHEFAYGVTTENPHYGPTRNPWDKTRIPGGSSGGSAAAIASGICCASIGTDTGGSIRIPAAHCGIVGLKPTGGLVSLAGVVPLSRSLDHVGPLARTVGDLRLLYDVTGPGPASYRKHQTAMQVGLLKMPRLGSSPGKKMLRGVVLGWPRDYFFERIDTSIRAAVQAAMRDLEALGARFEEISLPQLHRATDPSTALALAEALEWHKSQGYWPARAAEYGEDVRKRLELGGDVRAIDYLDAWKIEAEVQLDFQIAFQKVHAMVAPVTPIAATPLGAKVVSIDGQDEPVRAALLRLCRPANFTHLPAMSLPCGFTSDGLPIGLQLIGQRWGEYDLCAIARAYEQSHDWHKRRPAV